MNVLLDECFAPDDVADRLGELLPPEWKCDSVYAVDLGGTYNGTLHERGRLRRVGDPGEVQVEVAAYGICSWDLQTFKAGADSPYTPPPGHEGVGYVSKLGEGVHGIEIGQCLVGGGFGRLRNLPANRVYKISRIASVRHDWADGAAQPTPGVQRYNLAIATDRRTCRHGLPKCDCR